ncbi:MULTISPECIES: hypothetical protein [unclassified Thermosipho (in: thermotogales)]|uniref:hypothetical protein n=1 Tax=unclassified Thermosipho (in: thermotogales) TaxID=2676525 RepID=UPI0009853CBF|nr:MULTISPECIES: hypothetical protein [unclassified Thermosipho (in: thermotogales)]MBT1247360.1 hypothetical protein [Thermosipho sp. 1244]OOC46958.1 hypothetical protein XO09_04165 [Thermosipho sp. 1223]
MQIPTLRKILSEPSYNKEFDLIISNIPDSFKNIFEDRLRDLIIGITDTIYSKEPQLIIGIGIYLKELKKHFNGVYESIKDKLFDVLKSNVANTESFISNLDEKILNDKTSNLLNVIESVLFIQKEENFDLINQMLEFSRYKVEILKSLIENKNKIDLDIEMLRETFYDLERDAQYLIELLDYIGKTFDKKTDELIKSIISKCIVVTDDMIDKCLKIFSNKINKAPTNDDYFSQIIDFLKGLGRILLFGKFAEQKGKIQTLVLNKFSSIFLSKILSVNNFSRDFIYIRFLLTFYSYFYSLETANEIRKLINSINNYQRIISNLPQDQNKVLPSSLATFFLVYNDIKNININFLNSIFSSADIEGIFDFIKEKEYEMEEFFKKEEIFETYSYLIENVSSQKNKITNLYRNIYEYLLEIEEYDLSWVFNLYKLLKDLEVSLEKIKNCVKRLSSKFSFDNVRIDKHSIELLNYLFGIRNEEKLIEEFEKIINKEIDKNIREELFTQPVFYECCANYQVKLIGNLHKNVFKAILDNLENFSKDNIEKIADFLIIQSNSFIKDFIEDFKQSIKTKAHSTDNIEQSEKEIDFIFEKFNFIFEKLVQNKREILEKEINDEFIRTLENLSTVPENVERFLKMVKE